MDEQAIKKLNGAISAVFIVAALVLFGAAIKGRGGKEAPVEAPSGSATSTAESPTQAYEDMDGMRHLEIAKDVASWTPNAKVEPEKVRGGTLVATGAVTKAFLTVKASVDGKPLTKYESFFLKLDDAGGHLFRPRSLPTPEASSTSLLYPLEAVAVLPGVPYDEAREPQAADLFAELSAGKPARLTAFISSMRPALIEELSISYVCAEGSDCSIALK